MIQRKARLRVMCIEYLHFYYKIKEFAPLFHTGAYLFVKAQKKLSKAHSKLLPFIRFACLGL